MADYKIYSYTIVRSTTENFLDRLPYCAVLLEDEEGKTFPAILEEVQDDSNLEIGLGVKRVTKEGQPDKFYLA